MFCVFCLCCCSVVIASTIDCLESERLISEMTYYVSHRAVLNHTHSLTHPYGALITYKLCKPRMVIEMFICVLL